MIRNRRRVGFWAAHGRGRVLQLSDLPEALLAVLEGFPFVEDAVDPTWDMRERDLVFRYVSDPTFEGQAYCGFSNCRICDCQNGIRDCSDGVYVWPEGFGHYIAIHGVKPPQHFIDHVLRRIDVRPRTR